LALPFPKPALSVRMAMVTRIAKAVDFQITDDAKKDLARMQASPALIENAIRTAARISSSATDARTILESGLRALGRREAPRAPEPLRFDPALSSADVDLAGPSGAGKSAYARYLAERLDLEVLEKRYSELSSKWLGESEKAMAAAFEEAADLRAFLILDEADSLLRDRGAARNAWEITQVNEMLTWMERHPFPFACTTNAPELLDAAAARRFLFKVRFLPMTAPQVAEAYRRAFGAEAPPLVLKLEGLTPADFATVVRKASTLDQIDPEVLTRWLVVEAQAKPDAGRQKIGF